MLNARLIATNTGRFPALVCSIKKETRKCGTPWGSRDTGADCRVCPSPPGLNGGSRDVSGKTDGRLYVGSVVRNSCNKGYLSEGPVEIKCIRDKGNIKWSHDINAFQCDKIPDEFASRYVPQ